MGTRRIVVSAAHASPSWNSSDPRLSKSLPLQLSTPDPGYLPGCRRPADNLGYYMSLLRTGLQPYDSQQQRLQNITGSRHKVGPRFPNSHFHLMRLCFEDKSLKHFKIRLRKQAAKCHNLKYNFPESGKSSTGKILFLIHKNNKTAKVEQRAPKPAATNAIGICVFT